MATKIFSGRADADKLALADALAKREYGMSFGQYCATVFLERVTTSGFPADVDCGEVEERRKKAYEFIKSFPAVPHNEAIGRMSDDEIKELIGGRYV